MLRLLDIMLIIMCIQVEWSISYSSVSTNFFVSHYENGQKDVPTSPYFTVDGAR